MFLTKRSDVESLLWYVDGRRLPEGFSLSSLLALRIEEIQKFLSQSAVDDSIEEGSLMAPIDAHQEVWASGVTYLRSRQEREAESAAADVYAKVYDADRPEIFFKSIGWRVQGHDQFLRIRRDSDWNVPEPELVLVVNRYGEIVGYTAGNDMSSRSIEGENPLYLPQAKTYDGSCALGPGIQLTTVEEMLNLTIHLEIWREGETIFRGETSVSQMKRKLPELVEYLTRELSFPHGAFLMTGTGIVPSYPFTLKQWDVVTIQIGDLILKNSVS